MIESKVVMKEEVEQDEYPKLMIGGITGNVVLFEREKKGTVVFLGPDSRAYKLGEVSDSFAMENFKPFQGKVVLTNK